MIEKRYIVAFAASGPGAFHPVQGWIEISGGKTSLVSLPDASRAEWLDLVKAARVALDPQIPTPSPLPPSPDALSPTDHSHGATP